MAKVVYKSYNRNEGSLLPVYLSDMVAPEHPARVVDAVVDSLDISGIERGYKGGGTSSYEPRARLDEAERVLEIERRDDARRNLR